MTGLSIPDGSGRFNGPLPKGPLTPAHLLFYSPRTVFPFKERIAMKKFSRPLAVMMLLLFTAAPVMAGGGLDVFINNLNVQARADMGAFSAKVSAQFGVPLPQVQAVIGTVQTPADAFLCFQLGQMARRPYREVVQIYHGHQGKGWGVVAKELGIKPGSPEFHALKRGDFALTGKPGDAGPAKDKGKGRGKGHNK